MVSVARLLGKIGKLELFKVNLPALTRRNLVIESNALGLNIATHYKSEALALVGSLLKAKFTKGTFDVHQRARLPRPLGLRGELVAYGGGAVPKDQQKELDEWAAKDVGSYGL